MFSTNILKQTATGRSPRCDNFVKTKFEPYVNLVDQTFRNLMRTWLTIKTHRAKLKMMKHQGQNIPIFRRQKQNLCNSHVYVQNIIRWWNGRRYKLVKCKEKEGLEMWFMHASKIMYNMMGIKLKHCRHFFNTEETLVNLIWW